MKRLSRSSSRSLLAVLVLLVPAPAQEQPAPWRILRDMEVDGAAAFDRDQIASALVVDGVTMRALQRGLDAEAAAVIAGRVQELHRRGGYAHAQARGEIVDGVLQIRLEAGKRFRCGPVRGSGNTRVTTGRLRELLGARAKASVFADDAEKLDAKSRAARAWVDGEFPVMDDAAARQAAAVVEAAYREVGRHGVHVETSFAPDDDRLALEVAVVDEGREVRIQSLRLVGEEESQRDAVLAAVKFTPGALATSAMLTDLQRQLEATGRYLDVKCELPAEAPAVLDPLTITVQVCPDATPVGSVSPRDVAQVRSAIDRLGARLEQGAVVRVTADVKEPQSWGRFRTLPGALKFVVSRDGFALEVERLQWGDGAVAGAAVCVGADGLAIVFGERKCSWRYGGVGVQAEVVTRMQPSGKFEFRFGAGVSSGLGDSLAIVLHPATALQLVTRASEVRRDGSDLVLRFETTTVRIAGDGALLDQELTFVRDGQKVAVTWGPDSLAEERRRIAASAAPTTVSGRAAMLLAGASALVADAFATMAIDDARVRAVLQGALEAASEPAPTGSPSEPSGAVPSLADGAAKSMTASLAGLVSIPAVQRSWSSRIADWSGALGAMMRGDTENSTSGLRSIAANAGHGPLSLGVGASLLQLLGNEPLAKFFRERAATRWGYDAAYADAADFAGNLTFLDWLPARVGARWRTMKELQETFAGLPAGEAGDLAAWRKGLELLWGAGGEQALRDALLPR